MTQERHKRGEVQDIEETTMRGSKRITDTKPLSFDSTLSTGSTVLDLNISGGRCEEGGIPGGIVVEIFGRPGSGKTSILSELAASAHNKGGDVMFKDPEARIDKEYFRIYGVKLDEKNYSRPDTVSEVFDSINEWEPKPKKVSAINLIATDSLAALSTELEMGPKGDKMGMKRAKEFSMGFRKLARVITNNNYLMACTNQVREGDYGEVTPGGQAIPFYSSLRIRINQTSIIEKELKLDSGAKVKKAKGIVSSCYIKKSTVDDPFRECEIYIVFNYGIDDIRGNLQYCKDIKQDTMYRTPNNKSFKGIEQAIQYIEENELAVDLKREVIALWNEVENAFKIERKTKQR